MRSKLQLCLVRFALLLAACLSTTSTAHASVSLLLEEPFGMFGSFNPTGHAAIYLSNVCAESPIRLRLCRPGELGVVISRYHRVHGLDWIAIPLIPYLYAVDDLSEIPESATPELKGQLRDSYRREHLLAIAPDVTPGIAPKGEWIQLVGASYDRRIFGFQLATTRDQDEAIIAKLNDSRNRSHFNLFFRNCADFARTVLRTAYPEAISRNSPADFWLTTPKHLARSVTRYGSERPKTDFQTFQIAQVPGTTPRSHKVNGIAESLVRSKKYLVPLAFLSPTTTISLVAAYVGTGRFVMPANAPVMPELSPMTTGIALNPNAIAIPEDMAESSPILACSVSAETHMFESLLSGGGQ